jgi:hypothetical protein
MSLVAAIYAAKLTEESATSLEVDEWNDVSRNGEGLRMQKRVMLMAELVEKESELNAARNEWLAKRRAMSSWGDA